MEATPDGMDAIKDGCEDVLGWPGHAVEDVVFWMERRHGGCTRTMTCVR